MPANNRLCVGPPPRLFFPYAYPSKEIGVDYCPTQDMVADIMTKGLPKVTFEKFRNSLGVHRVVLFNVAPCFGLQIFLI